MLKLVSNPHALQRVVRVLRRLSPSRHRREIGRQIGGPDLAVGIPILIDVHAGPDAGLHKNSDIGISRDAVFGFAILTGDRPVASGVGALLNNWRCADREAALIENLLVPALVDFFPSPRADAGNFGVLDVRIDVETG